MKRLTLCLLVLLACAVVVAVGSAPAYAVDGVVLINQNTIINGLPGCPTGGHFPIIICESGSYRLSGNLTVPPFSDGIDINVDDVTLDLNGFTILGPGNCTGFPVTSCTGNGGIGIFSRADNISVRNGSVVGFFDGVVLDANGELVDRVRAKFNGALNLLTGGLEGVGIGIFRGAVRFSSATENPTGIVVEAGGVAEANTAVGNQIGINLNRSSAIGNALVGNNYGFYLESTTFGSNSLQGNTTNVFNVGGATSQNNNNCDGSVC